MNDRRAALCSWEGQTGAWRKGRRKTGLTTSPSPSPQPCESESEVARSCLTLGNPMDCSLPGSSFHGIFQARVLEWDAIAYSRGSSQLRD